jgi:hypothetical protein
MLNLSPRTRARAEPRVEERRNSRDVVAVRSYLTRGDTSGDTRVEVTGAAEGTTGTAMRGCGGGIFAALPMPLGSLTELLSPPALPGPGGMPLTPASCAKDVAGAESQAASASAKKADLPNMIALRGSSANE